MNCDEYAKRVSRSQRMVGTVNLGVGGETRLCLGGDPTVGWRCMQRLYRSMHASHPANDGYGTERYMGHRARWIVEWWVGWWWRIKAVSKEILSARRWQCGLESLSCLGCKNCGINVK